MFRLKLPLAAVEAAPSVYDLAIGSLRALVVTGRPDDLDELRRQRHEAQRAADPLDPRHVERRRRARRIEVALRRGECLWATEARLRAEAQARVEAGRARNEERRRRLAEVEAVEAPHREVLVWLAGAPRWIRKQVHTLAWGVLGIEAWKRRRGADSALLLEHRRAVVEVLRAESVGLCRFPLARVGGS